MPINYIVCLSFKLKSLNMQQTLRDSIIQKLSLGPKAVPPLVAELAAEQAISIQAVYKMIRDLRKKEIVSIHGKKISLSLIWVAGQKEKYVFIEKSYHNIAYIRNLIEGAARSVQFTFKTLNELELFWTHVYTLIAESVDPSFPTYSIQPHDWYPYARGATNKFWESSHVKTNRVSRYVITHVEALDKEVLQKTRERLGKLVEFVIHENPLKQESSVYYNLLDDFVFKAVFDLEVTKQLDEFIRFNPKLPLSREAQTKISHIMAQKGKFTLTIYKSETKALAMEKKVKKFFE
jgi:hypothetical protein